MQTTKAYVEADWSVGNVTAPLPLNARGGSITMQITVTGTINFDVQSSNSDLQSGATGLWNADTDTAAITATKWVTFVSSPRFVRLNINSFTTGATVTLGIAQSDV